MRRARSPHPCSSAPPSVLANVTSTQSLRGGEPLVSANTPRPASASTRQLASAATIVFSRRPQRSGSDSRRDWSNMIIAPGRLLGGLEGERRGVDAVALSVRPRPVVEDVAQVPAAGAADDLGAAHEQAVVGAQLD